LDDGHGTSRASFAERLRRLRADAGLSQKDLEKRSGIPKSRISRYENGHLLPSIGGLQRLADSLEIPDSALLREDDDPYGAFVRVLRRRGISFASDAEAERAAEEVADIITGDQSAAQAQTRRGRS
jgi:transcriptional regulator with XRE-family HTH domain